jgi:hypothetical protein
MSQDPFYEQILAGLNGSLNPQDFEDCMADLLRDAFPGLVPVHGGKDSGMDGAIADDESEGEPFPLVTTTAENVERNLQKSLDSFLKRKQPPRKVIFATSQSLTPQKRLKLMDLAREKGFTLRQVIEQRGIADRLYKSPRWCKQLLGLSGQPSALSVVPPTRRPLLDLDPIGRDRDLEWLRQTVGDRVISGEPGSGKTFLLYHLALDGWGLFLVDPDGDVAGALREQRPSVVIVDDAHTQPEILGKLRHLRQETRMDFSIVATTWEGARDRVIEAMGGIPGDRVRKLELLTRSQIVEVFRSVGVQEDPDTMRYLVDQAANKPGLAVTIAILWLEGSWQEVIDGKALSRTLLAFFQEFVGPEATNVLAAFSLGGSRGMEVEDVREFLGLNRLQIWQITRDLAAGGVLSEIDRNVLAVRPGPLRLALIRTVFFPLSGLRRDYKDLLSRAPSYDKAISTMIASRFLGANITDEELGGLVEESNSAGVWSDFARLSRETAKWTLDNYPGNLLEVAPALLHQIPRLVIPRILARAAEFSRTGEFRPESAMSMLSSWVQEISAGPEEWIRRRETLASMAREFLLQGNEPGIGMYGLSIALSPAVRGDSLDPGMGNTVIMRSGLIPVETLRKVVPIWENVRDAIQDVDAASWQHLSSLLWDWLHPEYVAKRTEISEEERWVTSTFVEKALRDLAPLSAGSPGLQAGLNRLAMKLEIDLGLGQDKVFELLYPPQDSSPEVRREAQAARDEAVRKLALEWARESPQDVAGRVAFYEREAQRIGHNWLQNMPTLCQALAEEVGQPEEWLEEFFAQNLRRHLVSPFLERVVDLRRTGWETVLESCLDREPLEWSALSLVLKLPDPSPELLDNALEKVEDDSMLVETLCLQGKVPLATLRRLLLLPSWEAALAAAIGEWCADPEGEVREEVRPEWRLAVLRSKTGEYEETRQTVGLQYWLRGILAGDADLALEWLQSRLKDSALPWSFMGDSPFAAAIRNLRREQKEELLGELQPVHILWSILPILIDSDIELYRKLLGMKSLRDYHLAPLEGLPGPAWESLALAALDAGHAPEAVAGATCGSSHSWVGSGVEYWESWDQAFTAFENHSREDLREVGQYGRAAVRDWLQDGQERQKRFELYGLGREE